jgi:hypothetical protein
MVFSQSNMIQGLRFQYDSDHNPGMTLIRFFSKGSTVSHLIPDQRSFLEKIRRATHKGRMIQMNSIEVENSIPA